MLRTLLLLLGLLATLPAAPSSSENAGRLARILTDRQVRVCIWPDYYAISYRNPKSGELEGIDIDLAREFARDLGVELRFIDSSFKTLIDDLLSDRCDISMHGVGIIPSRAEKLAFSAPYLRSGIFAIATKTHPTVKAWEDIDQDGIVVAVQDGTFMVDAMRRELKAARLAVVQTPEAREQEVISGRADVFMTDYPYSRRMLARHDWAKLLSPPRPVAPTSYAYAVAPGDADWLAAVNGFVARIKADGRLLKYARAHGLDPIVHLD